MQYTKRNHKIGGNNKYNTKLCNDNISFQDCELAILRHAVDLSEKESKKQIVNGPEISKIIGILEKFLVDKQLICYGGLAINNLLPKKKQFYDRTSEIPDYDFYSPNPLEDAIELADIYHKAGYKEIEAKSGVHFGTFKVYVNNIPVSDTTLLDKVVFDSLKKDAIKIDGILYADPNFLRMNMFLELSRPRGDVSRWSKVLKRLNLLNQYYPMPIDNCSKVEFLRKMEIEETAFGEKIHTIVRDVIISGKGVFFGGYAISNYGKYMPNKHKNKISKIPDFDVLSEFPQKLVDSITNKLKKANFDNVNVVVHDAIGEIIPKHFEIKISNESICFVYQTIACHGYNVIKLGTKKINIATIDTIMSFYLAFYYIDKPYYYQDRLMCMIHFLFSVENKNRLEQKGLLKRFTTTCIGKQPSLMDIRAEKSLKFIELGSMKGTKEYDMWFLKYNPNGYKEQKKYPKSEKKYRHNKTMKNRKKTTTKSKIFDKILHKD
jgi:hypothetical protein